MNVGIKNEREAALRRSLLKADLAKAIKESEHLSDAARSDWFYRPGDLSDLPTLPQVIPSDIEPRYNSVEIQLAEAPELFGKANHPARSLDEAIRHAEESFSQMLVRKIDEAGIRDVACYKRAHVDRKLFSKIRSDNDYRPSKITAIAFAIALELPLDEAKELLLKAGYAFSKSSKFDIIIEFFINRQNFNLFEINEALFSFNQPLLY